MRKSERERDCPKATALKRGTCNFLFGAGAWRAPWAPLPEAPALATPALPASRWRWAKLALLAVAGIGGIAAFGLALGGSILRPALPRPVLFWLFAAYWLALTALAAGLFDWRWQRETGEPLGLHRMLGEQTARWLLLFGGIAVMIVIVCLIGQ